MSDLHFWTEGFFISYYPNTEAGKIAWYEMINHSPEGKFLAINKKQINTQLKAAGYSVRKAPTVRMTKGEIEYLFGEVG
jgi:hypothetical protein